MRNFKSTLGGFSLNGTIYENAIFLISHEIELNHLFGSN